MFKQKKLSLGARFGLSVASFFLALLLFVSLLATTLIINIRVATSEDTVKEIIHALLSSPSPSQKEETESPEQEDAPAIYALRAPTVYALRAPQQEEPSYTEEEPDEVAADLSQQLIDMLYEELGAQIGEEMPVSKEDFTSLINESTAKDYIADKTAGLITDYFNDEITTTFTAEEILTLIDENRELIEAVVGEPLPEDVAQQVANVFVENTIVQKVEAEGLKGFMELLNEAEGEEGGSSLNFLGVIDTVVTALRTVSSTSNLVLGIGICVVLMAAIILINCRQIGKGLRRIAYPFLFVGLGLAPCMLVQYITLEGDLAMLLPVIQKLIGAFIPVYAVILGIGVLFLVAGIVLPIILRVKGLIPVSVPVTEETEELAAAIVDETPVEIEEVSTEEAVEEAPVEETSIEEEATPVAE